MTEAIEAKPKIGIYCVKCRDERFPTEITATTLKFTIKKTNKPGQRFCINAICPVCGIKMMRFVKKEEWEKQATSIPDATSTPEATSTPTTSTPDETPKR